MANRHLARSIVLQSLFEIDFRSYPNTEMDEVLSRNSTEFAPEVIDNAFMRDLIDGILQKRSDIDLIITKAAPDWPIDKISTIDRNILRMGLYELLFSNSDEVPAKVAINEAIELAKTYGGEKSGKFVNGVLGSVYKELGEPGKDQVSKKERKERPPVVPYEKMPIEKLGGAVVYAKHDGEIYLAFVHDVFGFWTLSKGKIPEEEVVEEGIPRKLKEEIGIEVKLHELLGQNEYVANHPEKGKVRKQVTYYLAEAKYGNLTLEKDSGGLDDVKWFKLDEIGDLKLYGDILTFITKALTILSGKVIVEQ